MKFVEYNPHKHSNYVTIQKGQWCASKLGMAGGPQPLYIALGCLVSQHINFNKKISSGLIIMKNEFIYGVVFSY